MAPKRKLPEFKVGKVVPGPHKEQGKVCVDDLVDNSW
jgi:hypothetical protein